MSFSVKCRCVVMGLIIELITIRSSTILRFGPNVMEIGNILEVILKGKDCICQNVVIWSVFGLFLSSRTCVFYL